MYAEVVRTRAFRELGDKRRQQLDEALLHDFFGGERRLFLSHQGHDLAYLPGTGTPGEQREIATQRIHIIYKKGEAMGFGGECRGRLFAVGMTVVVFVAVSAIILVGFGGIGQYLIVASVDVEYDFTHESWYIVQLFSVVFQRILSKCSTAFQRFSTDLFPGALCRTFAA